MQTKEMKNLLKNIRRAIEDTKDWNELYDVGGELELLSGQAEDRLIELSDGGE